MLQKTSYRVLEPVSVAWWFALALFADRSKNVIQRDLALNEAARIAAERMAEHAAPSDS